jgi:hypothetical protein
MLASWYRLAHGLADSPEKLGFLFSEDLRRTLVTLARRSQPAAADLDLIADLQSLFRRFSREMARHQGDAREAFADLEKQYHGREFTEPGQRTLWTPRKRLSWILQAGAWRLDEVTFLRTQK